MSIAGKKLLILLLLALAGAGYLIYRTINSPNDSAEMEEARKAIENRDFYEAGTHLSKQLKETPDDPNILLLAARTARRQKAYVLAMEHLDHLEKLNLLQDAVRLERKLVQIQSGNLDEANSILSLCVTDPQPPDAYFALEAIIVASLEVLDPIWSAGRWHESETAPNQLLTALHAADLWLPLHRGQADRIQGLIWRAQLYGYANNKPMWYADLHEALKIDPNHIEARLELANALSKGWPEEAKAHLDFLYQRHSTNMRVCLLLAAVRRNLGEYDNARLLLNELLATDPDNAQALFERGNVEMDANRVVEAEEWLRRAPALAPNQPQYNIALSRCLQICGNLTEAKLYQDRYLLIIGKLPPK